MLLLWLVARAAERIAPGTGVATAITLGAATLVLPFSTLYFSHILSALLSFAAFVLVWRERDRERERRAARGTSRSPACSPAWPSCASTRSRSPAAIVGLYALVPRAPGLVRRALAYGGGLAAGVAPLLAYQWWAFGSPLHLAYDNAVAETGLSGHAEIGLNDAASSGSRCRARALRSSCCSAGAGC